MVGGFLLLFSFIGTALALRPLITLSSTLPLSSSFLKQRNSDDLITQSSLALSSSPGAAAAAVRDNGAADPPLQVQESLKWIFSENMKLNQHQQKINNFLESRKVFLSSLDNGTSPSPIVIRRRKSLIVESTPQTSYFCRLSLSNAEPGEKLIAPCGCTGSQQVPSFSSSSSLFLFSSPPLLLFPSDEPLRLSGSKYQRLIA
jgi:hypothetical protein